VAIDGGAKVLVPATGRGLHQPINTTSFHVEVLHLDPCHIHLVLFYGNGAVALRHFLAAWIQRINLFRIIKCKKIFFQIII